MKDFSSFQGRSSKTSRRVTTLAGCCSLLSGKLHSIWTVGKKCLFLLHIEDNTIYTIEFNHMIPSEKLELPPFFTAILAIKPKHSCLQNNIKNLYTNLVQIRVKRHSSTIVRVTKPMCKCSVVTKQKYLQNPTLEALQTNRIKLSFQLRSWIADKIYWQQYNDCDLQWGNTERIWPIYFLHISLRKQIRRLQKSLKWNCTKEGCNIIESRKTEFLQMQIKSSFTGKHVAVLIYSSWRFCSQTE